MLFTSLTAEREFHDAHIASLEQACETPGGYSREFLTALQNIAQRSLDAMPLHPISTADSWAIPVLIDRRRNDTRRLKAIVAECKILLNGVPCEFDEAASELAAWLDEDPALEASADFALVAGRAA